MVLQNPEFAFALILVLALLIVLQSFFFVRVFVLLNRQLKFLDQKISGLLGKAADYIPTARTLLEKTVRKVSAILRAVQVATDHLANRP